MNVAVRSGIGGSLEAADADPTVGAIVVTGTGDRSFCAGADLRSPYRGGASPPDEETRRGLDAYVRFVREGTAKPVVAAANGAAVGGGFELLLACDMAVVADDARFGLPEVTRGLIPGSGGCHLGLRIPIGLALELALTGDLIDARRALDLGLVNHVVPRDRVLHDAIALAERIAGNAPLAVRAAKRLILTALRRSPGDAWKLQDEIQADVVASEDAKEGAVAFLEKRAPRWQGR
jgi:enoyl-CoA hydratase